MGKKMVVVPDLMPEWLDKRARIFHELDRQLIRGLKEPDKGMALDQLQLVIEHRNPFDQNLINCSAYPLIPTGWSLRRHRKADWLEWDPAKIKLHLEIGQHVCKCLRGYELEEALENKPVLNACVLDWLLAHPKLIPENWKSRYIFFWGTIYRSKDGSVYVRGLCWHPDCDRWDGHYVCLIDLWDSRCPAALRA